MVIDIYDINFQTIVDYEELLVQQLDNKQVIFDFKNGGFAKPAGVTLFISFIRKMRSSKKVLIQNYNLSVDRNKYLSRVDFFNELGVKIKEDFDRHNSSGRFIEITKINDERTNDETYHKLGVLLKSNLPSDTENEKNLILGILFSINEVNDNILEHSESSEFSYLRDRTLKDFGFFSAQYYPQDNNIEIGISDSGMGIVNSLETVFDDNSIKREDILLNAFKENNTRFIKTQPNRGNGLAKLKQFVLETNGSLKCKTNEFLVEFSMNYQNGKVIYLKDDFKGTSFEIKINCDKTVDTLKIFNATSSDYDKNDNDINNDLGDLFI